MCAEPELSTATRSILPFTWALDLGSETIKSSVIISPFFETFLKISSTLSF